MDASFLQIMPDVQAALDAGRPVVALESTVISHGLPFPQNLELARRLETIVRENGATPATIAFADGKVRVGLDGSVVERLATEEGVTKVSLRDLGWVLAEKKLGATTVAATMWAAHVAGISVFATGGIGGVHPGDGSDVSADLPALATIPVCVVSSGAKAILDLPRTREWLETWGVPVLGFQTDQMPAFYSRASGLPADRAVRDEHEAARYVHTHLSLGRGGVLLGVPVPEAEALPSETVLQWIAAAQREAERHGVRGYGLTPFLLGDLATRSEGQSLRANLALLENNAAVAARLSVQLSTLAP
ncbi:MAG TPA: pseudouridine-5'-phosphate glycosidase [Ardenticatenaceae bacterium]|jgi:pseudouridine-5'-phosphate glycosidase